MDTATATPPARNHADELIAQLRSAGSNDDLSFATRRDTSFTRSIIIAARLAVLQDDTGILVNELRQIAPQIGTNQMLSYLSTSVLAVMRALLLQSGDYQFLPKPKEDTHDAPGS